MRTATSPSASDPSGHTGFTVVGNPGNRRVALFAAAVRAAGLPPPRVLPWLEVAGGRIAVEAGALVRIDSPGEDAEVDRLLRGATPCSSTCTCRSARCAAASATCSPALHYSFDYAVGAASVKSIVADFLERSADGLATAEIGFRLDDGEQRRRWLLKSLLRTEGVDLPAYRRRFGTGLADDFPQLLRLGELGWLEAAGPDGTLRLTAEGLAFSDTIGPWLFSDGVRQAMDAWEPR